METYSDIFIWVRMPFLLKICLFDSWIIKGNLSMELYWHAVLNLELLVLYMTVWLITRLEHNPKQILAPFFQKEPIFKNTISKFIYHVYIWFIYYVNVIPFFQLWQSGSSLWLHQWIVSGSYWYLCLHGGPWAISGTPCSIHRETSG